VPVEGVEDPCREAPGALHARAEEAMMTTPSESWRALLAADQRMLTASPGSLERRIATAAASEARIAWVETLEGSEE
jgi:hypothetical protein